MTTKQRARQRRREDDGSRAGAGDTASADHAQRSPDPELLRLQALGGNAAVQRLVTESAQLQREDLEEEEERAVTETQPAEVVTETDGAGAGSEGPVGAGAVMASMWSAGVLGPLGRAFEHIEGGTEEDLWNAYSALKEAFGFVLQSAGPIASSFPDAEIANHDVMEGIQVVWLALEPHLGQTGRPLEEISGKLTSVTARATDFSEVFEG